MTVRVPMMPTIVQFLLSDRGIDRGDCIDEG